MRAYIPMTLPGLARWVADGEATVAGPAYAVTPALREWYREGDLEELEHVAQTDAARASLELLAHDQSAPRRRAVLVVDAADGDVTPQVGGVRTSVRLPLHVPRRGWACVLIDGADAAVAVASGVAQLGRAALGDEDARFALDETDAYELAWYGVQEIDELLRQVGIAVPE